MASVAALLCLPACQASVFQREQEFHIPAGNLSSTLIEIGRCSGVIVSFRPELVSTRSVMPIHGRFSLREALGHALRGTNLSVDIKPDGVVTVQPQPPAVHGASEPVGMASPVDGGTLSAVLVRASTDTTADTGLLPAVASTATRTSTALSGLPQAVSVITRDALDLQNAQTSTDALLHVMGVTGQINDVSLSMVPSLAIRGFPAVTLLSGMRTLRNEMPLDSETLERIEVLKGPSGVIDGSADTGGRGGTINLVRKRAGPDHQDAVTMGWSTLDSGTWRSSFDLGAPMAPDTYWRLVGYGSRSGHTDGGYDAQGSRGLLGVLTHRESDFDATLTLQADRRRDVPAPASRVLVSADSGQVVGVGGEVSALSSGDRTLSRAADIELELAWRISRKWRSTLKLRQESVQRDVRRHLYWDTSEFPMAILSLQHSRSRSSGLQTGLSGHVATGAVNHQLLFAVDLERSRISLDDGYAFWGLDSTTFQPGASMLAGIPDMGDPFALQPGWGERASRHGLLLQDQLSWGAWSARLAMQQTRVSGRTKVDADANGISDSEEPYATPKALNWDAGLAYQLTPLAAVYGGLQSAEALGDWSADPVLLLDGKMSRMPHMRQAQAGVKFDLLDDRLALTLEAFRLRHLGIMAYSQESSGFFTHSGRDVRGLEMEMKGRVLPTLDMSLGLSVMRARDTYPSILGQATQLCSAPATGVPTRSLSLLARYRLPETVARDSSVGLALRAFSSLWSSAPDAEGVVPPLRLPGGARTDLSWTRRNGPWKFGVSVQNLFDRRLYGTFSTQGYMPLQPRRSLGLTLAYGG